jgi:hypothetical protein
MRSRLADAWAAASARLPFPLWTVAVAVGIGVAARMLSLRPGDAVLLAALAFVACLVRVVSGAGRAILWPPARRLEASGTRREISALTWTFVGRDGRVSEAAVRRLREVAAHRLARHGVIVPEDLGVRRQPPPERAADLERARAMLGERVWRTLHATGGLPSLNDIAYTVDVLERLSPGAATAGSSSWTDRTDARPDGASATTTTDDSRTSERQHP